MAIIPGIGASSMHGAVVPIAKIFVSAGTNNVTFSSIPQGYQDLTLVVSMVGNSSYTALQYFIQLNGIGTGYSDTFLYGNGASAGSIRDTSAGYWYCGYFAGAASGYPGSAVVNILNYANTTTYKTMLEKWAGDANGSGQPGIRVGLLQSTSAVTSMTLYAAQGNNLFGVGTTFSLYGVRTVNQ